MSQQRKLVPSVVRLFGPAAKIGEAVQDVPHALERMEIARSLEVARAQFDETMFRAAWAEGQAMTLEQAVAYALETNPE